MLKKLYLLAIVSLFFFPKMSNCQNHDFEVSRNPGDFEEIVVSGKFDVEIIPTEESEKVEYTVEGIKDEDIIVENRNGEMTLKVKFTKLLTKDYVVYARIYYKDINKVIVENGAEATLTDNKKRKRIMIGSNSGATIKYTGESTSLELNTKAGGVINAFGSCKYLEASSNTGGSIFAFNMIASNVDANLKAGGDIEVTALEKIDARVSLGGTITYKGNPAVVNQKTTLGGNVISKN
ncbi:MAG: head GIN domain-containing protein [Hyphomicrobiales bacterium]